MNVEFVPYGFIVNIYRRGRTTVRLEFEEVPPKRFRGRTKYFCTIELGIYSGQTFRVMGSFEIEDWFNFKSEIKKRNKLKAILGVNLYNELVYCAEQAVNGAFQNGITSS
jgi:hypothetical protein